MVVVDVYMHYYLSPHFLDDTRQLAAQFNAAHPGYQIEVHGFDYQELPAEIAKAVARGAKPAVAQYFYSSGQLARDMLDKDGRPLFTSVAKAIAGRPEILGEQVVTDDLLPTIRDYYSIDDELLSMPTLGSTTLLYGNTTLLAKAGVTSLPQTWSEVGVACAALAQLPDGPRHAITWPNHGWMFQQALAQQGGLLANHDNGRSARADKVDLASPEMRSYLQWWQWLHKRGYYLHTGTLPIGDGASQVWEDNYTAFARQEVALVLSSSVEAERMVGAGRSAGFAVAAGPLPRNKLSSDAAGPVIGGDSLWLAAGLDQETQDGALAFMQLLNRPDIAAERHKYGHYVPITKSATALLTEQGWFAENPHRKVAVEILLAGNPTAAGRGALLGDLAGIQDVMALAMHDVLITGKAAPPRFAEATAQAQELLDDYNDHCLGKVAGERGPHRFAVG
jgi:sn-glycerol 3-phosphate transport system substrate-binding protein